MISSRDDKQTNTQTQRTNENTTMTRTTTATFFTSLSRMHGDDDSEFLKATFYENTYIISNMKP